MQKDTYTIGLIGNPNVGKSTVFNRLTGLKQHTGNWTGKTVESAIGAYSHMQKSYTVIDTPGTYGLNACSPEETVTRDFIQSGAAEVLVIIADATCLERNLLLTLEVLEHTKDAVLCLNLSDEAKKRGIEIDVHGLQRALDIPVVRTASRGGKGIETLKSTVALACSIARSGVRRPRTPASTEARAAEAEQLFSDFVHVPENADAADRRLDTILTHPVWGTFSMLALLFLVFYITVIGANYPSQLLQRLLFSFEPALKGLLSFLPPRLTDLLTSGIYRTLAWVVSVMLPPMAIFFPLFSLLEDFGFLPRVALNLDGAFRRAGAHGKQSLTMCMGFGCNACGVTGCRIIDAPRERDIAIVTNSLVPCNGRFPTLLALIGMFFTGTLTGAQAQLATGAWLFLLILLSIAATLFASFVLSRTVLRGRCAGFALELPPYRAPAPGQILVRSLFDRTLVLLGRAVCVTVPAGALIWLLANVNIGEVSVLSHLRAFFEPVARPFGLDGMILLAFILGIPANETVLPILLMGYTASGSLCELSDLADLRLLLIQNGWSIKTAVCMCVFMLFHFPCATTLLTIQKETRDLKKTLLAFLVPTLLGLALCFCINLLF